MNPGDTEFPPVCNQCGEPIITVRTGKGKRATRTDTCACVAAPAVESGTIPKKRSVKNTAAKGRSGEQEFARLAKDAGWDPFRTAGSGAHGSRNNESSQDTDVVIRKMVEGNERARFKVECKRFAKVGGLTTMENLRSRSDILWVRQDHGKGFVWMPDDIFAAFLAYAEGGVK